MRRGTMLERQRQKSCTDLPTIFELLCTTMFLYGFNNVCMDGVIQQGIKPRDGVKIQAFVQ